MKKIFKSILLISIMFYFGCDDNPSKPSNEIKNPFSNLSGSKDGYLISTIMKSYDKEGLNFTNHSKQDYYFYDSSSFCWRCF